MANAPIIYPRLWSSSSGSFPCPLRATVSDGSATLVAGHFVSASLVAGVLTAAAYVADGTGIYGLMLDPSHTATEEAYSSIFGENHNPVDPRGAVFIMNITDASGSVGSGSTTHADVAIGTKYSGFYMSAPATALGIDSSDSGVATKNLFQVVGYYNTQVAPDGDAATDYNGRVLVKIVEAQIQ
jgi:hypothetical protein